MSGFLVATNVISEILRAAPDDNVAVWSQQSAKHMLFLSVVSMGELPKGVTILPPSARRTQLEKSIEAQVPIWFQSRILRVTQAIAERWGELDGIRQLAGRPLNTPDGMIATALEHGLTLVTRNTKDFAGLGVFTAQINNDHTRKAYMKATRRFAERCEAHGIGQLPDVRPSHVAAFAKEPRRDFRRPQ